MLSKKEWSKKYVVKWQGIKNCDTKKVEGGYLFLRDENGEIIGRGTRNVSNRNEAIDYHYGCYIQAQSKFKFTTTTETGKKDAMEEIAKWLNDEPSFELVAGEGAPQYTFDVKPDQQLVLL